MTDKLLREIDFLIENATDDLIKDIKEFVGIKSVRETSALGAPFGQNNAEVQKLFLAKSEKEGFFCKDYGVGVVSAALYPEKPDLGVWLHGDVVAEGVGWEFPPYDAQVAGDCVIGRGVSDNKGQLAAILRLFAILKKVGIKFSYNPAIFLGSNEETGMKDIKGDKENPYAKGFLNVAKPPKISLIPDDDFPVAKGAMGAVNIFLTGTDVLDGFTVSCRTSENPGVATAVFDRKVCGKMEGCNISCGDKTEISAFTVPRHSAHPDEKGDAITVLTAALLSFSAVAEKDRKYLEFLNRVSVDIEGKSFDIRSKNGELVGVVPSIKDLYCTEGKICVNLRVRFPAWTDCGTVADKVAGLAEKYGFKLQREVLDTPAYIHDDNDEILNTLCNVYNDFSGENAKPYYGAGATYANVLPRAYVFGTGANRPPENFENGRGFAHGVDEAVSVSRLKKAMKIYARALLKFDEKGL